ncbi:MAG: flagellar M-ring protein FliF, partial [Pseudomonadota bacterium]
MQNLIAVWMGMTAQRRVVVVLATVAMFAAVLTIARMANSPTLSLLYAGIDGPASADVIRALDQEGVAYEVRGTSVYVEAARRDQLRLTLAGEGLPANGAQGYEILDGLSGFGTTAQMFDAAYWRAKEGELARTIVASPLVSAARVHLSASQSQPFRRDQALSGSVTVTPNAASLGAGQANALRHLVASAVAGLEPVD